MPGPLRADWNLASALYAEGMAYTEIAERIGVTPPTLRRHAHRHGWRRLGENGLATVSQTVGKTQDERSRETRDMLAQEIERQAKLLTECPPESVQELANNRERQGRTAVVKTLSEAAEKLFAWQPEPPPALITVGLVENMLQVVDADVLVQPEVESLPVPVQSAARDDSHGAASDLQASA